MPTSTPRPRFSALPRCDDGFVLYKPTMSSLSKDGSTLPLQGRGNRSSDPVDGHTHCLRIVVCAGPEAGRAFELDKEVLVLGRGETADVPLTDPTAVPAGAQRSAGHPARAHG